ncbi:recombinase family protein [Sinomonas sp. B1-1]|uniref:recombinase family protein n=1 Tax=Sinomonas sp. B1-1 TaxID=3141454 RepID=UPI003D2DCE42
MRTRAAIYLRISLDPTGEGLAIERQREDCEALAAARGWTVVHTYKDNVGASDRRKKRPDYDRMVQDYAAGRFGAIVCWDLDRLTRQPRQLEDWIDAAEERGLLLVTANGEADLATDGGRMFARIKAAVARGEMERKAERQRRAARQRAEKGRPPLGVRLTGYTPKGDLVPVEAEFVREVFERFYAGDSLRSLAAWAHEQGFPTRHGTPWNPSSIRAMLTNPRYAARAIYQGKVIDKPGGWTRIVEDDVFTVVQAKLNDPRRRTHQGTDRKHLGSGLFRCGVCGQQLVSWSGDRYRCTTKGHMTRAQGHIDAYVLAAVRARLARPDVADLVTAPAPEDLEAAERARKARLSIAATEADYDADRIDGHRYKVKTDRLKAELAAAEAAMQRLANPASSVLLSNDPVAAFDSSPLMIRRTVVDTLCEVLIHPAPRGSRTFDPASVELRPR